MSEQALQDRLRALIKDRTKAGEFTVAELAKRSGLSQGFLSAYTRGIKKRMDLATMLRALQAMSLSLADLLEAPPPPVPAQGAVIPLVKHKTAATVEVITPRLVLADSGISTCAFSKRKSLATGNRRRWTRYVAIRPTRAQCNFMHPAIHEKLILVIDRHFTRTDLPHRKLETVYAVGQGEFLYLGYLRRARGGIILCPATTASEPLDIDLGTRHVVIGSVCFRGSE